MDSPWPQFVYCTPDLGWRLVYVGLKPYVWGGILNPKSCLEGYFLHCVIWSSYELNSKSIHTGPQQAGTGLIIQGPHLVPTHTGARRLQTLLPAPQKVDPRSPTQRVRIPPLYRKSWALLALRRILASFLLHASLLHVQTLGGALTYVISSNSSSFWAADR